jgi:hypothetical protein
MDSNNLPITKLNGVNFCDWSEQVQLFLSLGVEKEPLSLQDFLNDTIGIESALDKKKTGTCLEVYSTLCRT